MSIRAVFCIGNVFVRRRRAGAAGVRAVECQDRLAAAREVAGGLGLIIGSSKEMECRFVSADGRREHYYGTIRKFGLDIGSTNAGTLAWDVFAPTAGPLHHALAGDYAGVAASATVGAGLGANAMVGGAGRSITLQSFSVQTQTGLNLAGGVSSMTLAAPAL